MQLEIKLSSLEIIGIAPRLTVVILVALPAPGLAGHEVARMALAHQLLEQALEGTTPGVAPAEPEFLLVIELLDSIHGAR